MGGVKQGVKQGVRHGVRHGAQEVVKEGVKQGVTEVAQEVVMGGVKQGVTEVGKAFTEEVAKAGFLASFSTAISSFVTLGLSPAGQTTLSILLANHNSGWLEMPKLIDGGKAEDGVVPTELNSVGIQYPQEPPPLLVEKAKQAYSESIESIKNKDLSFIKDLFV